MADMEIFYKYLMIINLYRHPKEGHGNFFSNESINIKICQITFGFFWMI